LRDYALLADGERGACRPDDSDAAQADGRPFRDDDVSVIEQDVLACISRGRCQVGAHPGRRGRGSARSGWLGRARGTARVAILLARAALARISRRMLSGTPQSCP